MPPPPVEDEFQHADMHLAVFDDGQWWDVLIGMYIRDDGESFDQAYEQARDEMLERFPGAIETDDGDVHAEYVTNGYSWPGATASWGYDNSGKPSGLSGDSQAMSAGANAWGSPGFDFTGGGSSSAGTGGCNGSRDDNNTVGWASRSGSTLAVTCTWYSGSTAIEFDMEFDPGWSWTTGGSTQIDLQSVATHEFGHALGLGHTSVSSAVMYASYSAGSVKRTLHSDDVAGVEAIYGSSGDDEPTSTPTNTPTPEPTNTPTPEPTSTPTPAPTSTPTPAPTSTPTPADDDSDSSPPPPTATPTATPTPSATPTPTVPGSLPIVPGANLVTWAGEDAGPERGPGGQRQRHSCHLQMGPWRAFLGALRPWPPRLGQHHPHHAQGRGLLGHRQWFRPGPHALTTVPGRAIAKAPACAGAFVLRHIARREHEKSVQIPLGCRGKQGVTSG
ncbi:MAG: matrixin family metalloprotease [Dehalococcoidia bacterium]|nr:matrixin family metalloprotease [Dehalococcoidia bacterium]